MVIDHHIIEQRQLAERYLEDELEPGLRAAFSDHVVDCEECWDRLQMAQIRLERKRVQPVEEAASTLFDHPENGYFDIHFTAPSEVAATKPLENHENRSASDVSTALAVAGARAWQLPTIITLAALLAVALEFIHQQQIELAQRQRPEEKIPVLARWVMQFEPWHLLLLGAMTALLLLLMPTTFFLWELHSMAR